MTARASFVCVSAAGVRCATLGCVCALAFAFCPQVRGSQPPGDEPVDYTIVVTGTELLAGAFSDGHTAFLTRSLHPLGLRCVLAMIVDDRAEEIQKAVQLGLDRGALVIVTGGLGPTEDDVTRQAISELTGIALREQPGVLAAMARRFNTPVDQLRANLRIQTEVPIQGGYLANSHGTAVGLVFETDRGLIVALPGPPRELQPMVREKLLPYLTEKVGIRGVGGLLKVRFVGIGESAVSDTLDRLVPIPDDVTVGSLFEGMRVDFYFSLPGAAPEDLARLDRLKEQILAHLGDYVYATGTASLESQVAALLADRQETLGLAEVGSGGSIAAALGGADALAGAYSAPTAGQLRRLLGLPAEHDTSDAAAAERLAGRLAELTGADWAVCVGPVREDASGGPYVEVVIRQPDGGTDRLPIRVRGARDLVRVNLTTQLLDLLWRRLRP